MMGSMLRRGAIDSGCAATTEPNQVGGLTATGGSGQISLSWTADSTAAPNAATSYVVERSNDGLGSWATIATGVTTNSYVDSGLGSSVTRHYRVSSVNCFGQQIASATANATTAVASYTVDALVVAGGGGGGDGILNNWTGCGGGAGGYRTSSGFSLTVGTTYTVTVGAGGAKNTQGSDSVFSTITSTGGGYGANQTLGSGGAGGSGGGGFPNAGAGNTPSTSPSQGNSGGASIANSGGGGGGAGATGQGGQSGGVGANGGAGTASSITGSSVTRAGGGGGAGTTAGGSGGSGGGGAGSFNGAATAGSVNTGGGGGGAYATANGGAGGSGVVILRMATANYSGTTTGSPTVTTSGSDTILTYNASGTYTA